MCGSRTGGWSLPSVMSDWQCCVDWFFNKYCGCRLRLDWCWCRWRTSAKGRCWWGLQVWRRQVGLVRGTRWPAGSSAGRMVARTARWSHGRFLGSASKPRSSWDYVGAESWVVIGGGYTEFARFAVVHQKTTGFLGWSTKPRPKNRRRRCSSIGPVWSVGLTGLTGGYRSDSSWFNEFWWTIIWLWSAHEVFLLSPKSCVNPWSESGDRELVLEDWPAGSVHTELPRHHWSDQCSWPVWPV
jgi:hypothetical protein